MNIKSLSCKSQFLNNKKINGVPLQIIPLPELKQEQTCKPCKTTCEPCNKTCEPCTKKCEPCNKTCEKCKECEICEKCQPCGLNPPGSKPGNKNCPETESWCQLLQQCIKKDEDCFCPWDHIWCPASQTCIKKSAKYTCSCKNRKQKWCAIKRSCMWKKTYDSQCKCGNKRKVWCEERQKCTFKKECKCKGNTIWCPGKNRCMEKGIYSDNCKCEGNKKWCEKKEKCIGRQKDCGGKKSVIEQLLAQNKEFEQLQKDAYEHYWQNCGFRYENETNIMTKRGANNVSPNSIVRNFITLI